MSTTESLAADYRPQNFDDVVGQTNIIPLQRALIINENHPQQMLFSGPSGTGKTTLARINAAAHLCETPLQERNNGNPCETCLNCQDILDRHRTHPDVLELDGASQGSVEKIRELIRIANLVPQRAKARIFIIDEAHQISNAGGSALLKTFEEPPAHVRFFLATTDPDKMLTANRGRVIEWALQRPTTSEMTRNILRVAKDKNWEITPELATAIVEATDPTLGVRGTLNTLQMVSPLLNQPNQHEEIYKALGIAAPHLVENLKTAYRTGNITITNQLLTTLETTGTNKTILQALLNNLNQEKHQAAETNNTTLIQQIITEEETLLNSLHHKHPLNIPIMKLTLNNTPQLTATQKLEQHTTETLKQALQGATLTPNGNTVQIHTTQEHLNQLRLNPELGQAAQAAGITLQPVPH